MAKSRDHYRRLFEALKAYEMTGARFTLPDLSVTTDYKISALSVYFRNRLKNVYVFTTDGVNYVCKDLAKLDYQVFSDYMSQKSSKVRKSDLESLLIEKSFEAFLLALELYNKPLLTYKIESVLLLLINAWELLLKSLLVRINGEKAIYYDEVKTRTLAIRDCVAKIMPEQSDVIRRNLEAVVDLRDQATHLVIPEIQSTLARLLQANVINFIRFAEKYNIRNMLLGRSAGLLSLVADVKDADQETIRLTYGAEIAAQIDDFLNRFHKEEREINSHFYAIPITYRFVLSNKSSEGDIAITLTRDGTTARVVEIPKDPDKTHPFRLTQLVDYINESLPDNSQLNRADLQSIIYCEKIRGDKANRFHYRADNPVTHKYSEEFAQLVLRKLREHKDYLDGCKAKYRQGRSLAKRNNE